MPGILMVLQEKTSIYDSSQNIVFKKLMFYADFIPILRL